MFAGQTNWKMGGKCLKILTKSIAFWIFLIDIYLYLMQRKLAFVCLLLVSHHVNWIIFFIQGRVKKGEIQLFYVADGLVALGTL